MIIYTVTLKRPSVDVPWLNAPAEANQVILDLMNAGKILHTEIVTHDEFTKSRVFIFSDSSVLDDLKNSPYSQFVKQHNEEHCAKYGIEISRTIEEV